MVTNAYFRSIFPEFTDITLYTDAQLTFWIQQAYNQISPARFGTSLDLAVMLYTAHQLVIAYRAAAASGPGGSPGRVGATYGPVTSKSVGPASVSYDMNLTAYAGAGFWNATNYGQRYYQLLLAFNTGPMYVPNRRARQAMPGDMGFPYSGRSDGF